MNEEIVNVINLKDIGECHISLADINNNKDKKYVSVN